MKTYARIQDGRVAELIQTDCDIAAMFNPALIWVDISEHVDVVEGWQFDGIDFSPPALHAPDAQVPTITELQAQLVALAARIAELASRG